MYQEIVERYGFKLECTYAERNTMEQVLEHIETKLDLNFKLRLSCTEKSIQKFCQSLNSPKVTNNFCKQLSIHKVNSTILYDVL